MYSIRYKIYLESPIILSESGGASNIIYTKTFIPGSIIRGMFAGRYIQQQLGNNKDAHESRDFYKIFLSGNVSFGPAYIATPTTNNYKENFPLPLSLQHAKENETEVYELLLNDSDEQTKPFQGYGRFENNFLCLQEVKKQFFFHHQRDRTTGTPEEGLFFTYESLAPRQVFIGELRFIEEELSQEFYNIFNNCSPIYFIGKSKSSQYGQVRVNLDLPQKAQDNINFTDREIPLTFISETIIYDEFRFGITDRQRLENYLNEILQNTGSVKISKAFLKIKEIENYVSVWKLRRPSELSLGAGSCCLLQILNGHPSSVVSCLSELSFLGLGERREEGFGRVILGWQRRGLRLAVEETDLNNPSVSHIVSSTSASPSEPTKKLVSKIVKNYLIREVGKSAQKDTEAYNLRNISKSSISRLASAYHRLRFIKDDKNGDKFINFLKSLNPKIKEEIKAIRNNEGNSLYSLLEKGPTYLANNVNKIVNKFSEYSIELSDEFGMVLEKEYFKIFFSILRQRLKIRDKR